MGRLNLSAALSKRETQIAELLAWGAAKKEVADLLHISPRTVENTARHIYEKIGIQKATELCVFWFCAKCGVDPARDPLKRAIVALSLLLLFLPYDFHAATTPNENQNHDLRPVRTTRVARPARVSRGRRTDKNLFKTIDF